MKYRGVAYYPEAWPPTRWGRDIDLMTAAGVNLVRMGEFAWSRLEPSAGQYALDWWADICSRFQAAGINILACTPTAAPPAWLTRAHPDVLTADSGGRRAPHGGRRHACPGSSRYRDLAAELIARQAGAVADNPAVLVWQLDNELCPAPHGCHCPDCTARFRAWLREGYGTLAALNEAWGNVFWSGEFSAWEEIAPPYPRLSWQLDYRRFLDETVAGFLASHAGLLRSIQPAWRLTTNQWAGLNPGGDVTACFAPLDVAACDCYFDYYARRELYAAAADFYRHVRGRPQAFWLTETGAWNPATVAAAPERALRPWAWSSFARGAEAMLYFRWRQSPMGEEEHPAVLDWSGRPGRAWRQLRSIFGELATLTDGLDALPLPECPAALLYDYASAFCAEHSGHHYVRHLVSAHASLARCGVPADVLPTGPLLLELTRYRLVILPQLAIVSDELAAHLRDFVEAGGVLWALPRLATRNRHGKYLPVAHPAGLCELFGLTVSERCVLQAQSPKLDFEPPEAPAPAAAEVAVGWRDAVDSAEDTAREYLELLCPEAVGVEVLATYRDGAYAGEPAVTSHRVGAGLAVYQGAWLDGAGTRRLQEHLLAIAGCAGGPALPPGVEVLQRGDLRFCLNHGAVPVVLPAPADAVPLVGEVADGQVRLNPYGVAVLRTADVAPAAPAAN